MFKDLVRAGVCISLCAVLAAPLPAWGLGLAEIEVESALNERLAARIELLDAQGFQSSEIIVSMASREDFERVGVERFFYLTDLRFTVVMNPDGSAYVNVTSANPIAEPYLNFLVEVLWPSGRLVKEFTVLLDPPTFSEAPAPAVAAPVQPAQVRPEAPAPVERVVVDQPATPVQLTRPQSVPPQTPPPEGVMTNRDDTLWKIATRTKASQQVTTNQQMLAIQRLNREAFIRDNINLLKAGYVLDIPTESEALSMDRSEADFIVANQISQWRNRQTGSDVASAAPEPVTSLRSQIDATPEDEFVAQADDDERGDVRIVASTGESGARTGAGNTAEVDELIEERAALTRQVDELSYQLDREKDLASNEIEVKDRQLEVKNQEVAELQAQLAAMREELANVRDSQPQPGEDQDVAWWQSPLVLYGVIGLLVILAAFLLLAMRRQRAEEDDALAAQYDYEDAEGETSRTIEPLVPTDAREAVEPDTSFEEEQPETEQLEPGETETTDVIGEAEIYIAYGRYDQATSLLQNVLADEPDRHDVRLKLLEVFVESGDTPGFQENAEYLGLNCDDQDILHAVRELEAQIDESQSADTEPEAEAPDVVVDDAPEEPATGTESSDEADTELEHDEVEIPDEVFSTVGEDAVEGREEEIEEETAEELVEGTEKEKEEDDEFELEFDDLDLDDIPEAQGVSQNTDDLGGDLGLDFDPEKDVDESVAEVSGDSDPEESDDDLDDLLEGLDLENEVTTGDSGADVAEDEGDFDFGDGSGDINSTKLDLAEAYIDMGDVDGAKDILREVVQDGSEEQQQKARDILAGIE